MTTHMQSGITERTLPSQDDLQQRIANLIWCIRAAEAAIHDDVIDGAAGPHCQEYWDYTVRSHYPYNGARDLHTEHTDDWQAAYNRLTALLQQRFPPLADGTRPDWAIEDVLEENAKLRAVADAARSALSCAEKRHLASMRAADNWNNNAPGVGQTCDYMSVEPLPDWAEELRTALDAKGDAH